MPPLYCKFISVVHPKKWSEHVFRTGKEFSALGVSVQPGRDVAVMFLVSASRECEDHRSVDLFESYVPLILCKSPGRTKVRKNKLASL